MTDNLKVTRKKENLKACAKCKKEKPADLEHFYKDARSKDDLGSYCIECQKAKSKKEKKRPIFEKGGIVSGKQDPLLSFPGFAMSAIGKTLVLNFTEHEDLLADIKAAAEEYFRTPEMQVMWWLTTRDKFMTGGGE